MTFFKRSELTADTLRQWEREAAAELILETAPTLFDLSMSIAEKTGGKVDIKDNGEIWVDGWSDGYWRKQGDMFVEYMPGTLSADNVTGNGAKIIRGPWK